MREGGTHTVREGGTHTVQGHLVGRALHSKGGMKGVTAPSPPLGARLMTGKPLTALENAREAVRLDAN